MSLYVLFVCVCVSGVDTIYIAPYLGVGCVAGGGGLTKVCQGWGGGEECHIPICVSQGSNIYKDTKP
jgi:hypothetical protein